MRRFLPFLLGCAVVVFLGSLNVGTAGADVACDKECGEGIETAHGTRDGSCRWRSCSGTNGTCDDWTWPNCNDAWAPAVPLQCSGVLE